MSAENNHKKKLDINDIMKTLETFYFSNKLDIYKPFIIKYTNYRNSEIEVMHIDFCFEKYHCMYKCMIQNKNLYALPLFNYSYS